MRFELILAWRHLVYGKSQTALTIGAVAISVMVVIFFQSVMNGVILKTLNDSIGAQAHITVKPPEQRPHLLSESTPPSNRNIGNSGNSGNIGNIGNSKKSKNSGNAERNSQRTVLIASAMDKQISQRKDIENWRQVESQLIQFPGVRLMASTVKGNGFVIRGAKRQGAEVVGGDPPLVERIYTVQKNIVAGRWLDIGTDSIVMGWRLADDCGLRLGDRVRIESSEGISASFLVAGLFDAGLDGLDRGRIYMNLRPAQSLFGMQENISAIDIKLDDPSTANETADAIAASLPYKVESWKREQPQIQSAINAQTGTRDAICFFALVSAAFAIASVLIVSVIQKTKQIGILKSIGAKDIQILRVFTLESLIIALLGCLLGCLMAYLMVSGFASISAPGRFGRTSEILPVKLVPSVFINACIAATVATLLAAILPARNAAKLDPVEAIRA